PDATLPVMVEARPTTGAPAGVSGCRAAQENRPKRHAHHNPATQEPVAPPRQPSNPHTHATRTRPSASRPPTHKRPANDALTAPARRNRPPPSACRPQARLVRARTRPPTPTRRGERTHLLTQEDRPQAPCAPQPS